MECIYKSAPVDWFVSGINEYQSQLRMQNSEEDWLYGNCVILLFSAPYQFCFEIGSFADK